MSVSDRFNLTATIKDTTMTVGDAGERVSASVELATGYKFFKYPTSVNARELIRAEHGLHSKSEVYKGTGEYNSNVATGCLLVVSRTETYKILGVHPQRNNDANVDSSHLALILVRSELVEIISAS